MNIRKHNEETARLLQKILEQPNARTAAQKELYNIKARLLTKARKEK